MRKITLILTAFLCAGAVWADTPEVHELAIREAKAVSEQCWKLSEIDFPNGVPLNIDETIQQREGYLTTLKCFDKHIRYLANEVFFSKHSSIIGEVEESIDKIIQGVGRLHWHLHNNNQWCIPSCGYAQTPFHNANVAYHLEGVVYSMYVKISEYNPKYFE